MKNCLSADKFANLLFVNVRIRGEKVSALFDTGAGMTVVARNTLERLGAVTENGFLRAGNNNGLLRRLQTAVLSDVRLGDIRMEKLRVLVADDADFALRDESGVDFPAGMLLGWDVISRYCWSYSAQSNTLSVGLSEKAPAHSDRNAGQGPVVFPEYAGYRFRAAVDTGHTGSILGAAWHTRLTDVGRHETETVGIGSAEHTSCPYIRDFTILCQGRLVHLRDVDIQEKIYGQPADIEALLGYDFLEGSDWQLDREFCLQ